jgi:Fe-S cluster assembly protein SufB
MTNKKSNQNNNISQESDYKYGFSTDLDQELIPKGISEDVIRLISAKKNEPQWLLEFRLKGYHKWLKQHDLGLTPTWADLNIDPIDYQEIIYYASTKTPEPTKPLSDYKQEWLKILAQ